MLNKTILALTTILVTASDTLAAKKTKPSTQGMMSLTLAASTRAPTPTRTFVSNCVGTGRRGM